MSLLKKSSYIISRFSQSGWGRLLFTYTRYFDKLPVDKNAMLFEMSAESFARSACDEGLACDDGAADGDMAAGGDVASQDGAAAGGDVASQDGAVHKGGVGLKDNAAFKLLEAALQRAMAQGAKLYVALYSCGSEGARADVGSSAEAVVETNAGAGICTGAENAVQQKIKQALFKAGFSEAQLKQCIFIKRHSKQYMRILASAAFLLADEGAFPSFFIRKNEQRLLCVPNEHIISKLDRHAVKDSMRFAHMQHVLLQSSFIACLSDELLQALVKNAMISQIYKGSYLLLDFSAVLDLAAVLNFVAAPNSESTFNPETAPNPEVAPSSTTVSNPPSNLKIIPAQSFYNQKPTVAIYGDTLRRTGIQSSLRSLLSKLDGNKANFILVHTQLPRSNDLDLAIYDGVDFLNSLPENIEHYGICKGRCMRYTEALAWVFHIKLHKNSAWVQKRLKKVFEREQKRTLAYVNFDILVHFTGYDFEMMHEMIQTKAQHKAIFIHNDMNLEAQTVQNVDIWSLRNACAAFDVICPVQPQLVNGLASTVPALDKSKICTVHNCIDDERIIKMSQHALSQTDYEQSCVSFEQLKAMLESNAPTFVWLARYTKQKGADRLLQAFEQLLQSGAKANLIMSGSCGELYPQICEQAKHIGEKYQGGEHSYTGEHLAPNEAFDLDERPYIGEHPHTSDHDISKHIAVIYAHHNPYALLKHADALVISSLHEGLPMVILEALILEKPVICTDISGVSQFLQENNYGTVVENSVEGIKYGMLDFVQNKPNNEQNFAHFDTEKYNKEALNEFYQALGL